MPGEVIATEQPNRIRIRLQVGTRDNGDPIIESLSYRVKEDAPHQNVYDTAVAIASLVQPKVVDCILTENKLLTE